MDKKFSTAVSSTWHALIATIVFYAVLWWLGESFPNKVHIEADTAKLSGTVCMKMAATQMPQSLHSLAWPGSQQFYFLIERELFFLAPQEGRSRENRKLGQILLSYSVLCLRVTVLTSSMSLPKILPTTCKAQTTKRDAEEGRAGREDGDSEEMAGGHSYGGQGCASQRSTEKVHSHSLCWDGVHRHSPAIFLVTPCARKIPHFLYCYLQTLWS